MTVIAPCMAEHSHCAPSKGLLCWIISLLSTITCCRMAHTSCSPSDCWPMAAAPMGVLQHVHALTDHVLSSRRVGTMVWARSCLFYLVKLGCSRQSPRSTVYLEHSLIRRPDASVVFTFSIGILLDAAGCRCIPMVRPSCSIESRIA